MNNAYLPGTNSAQYKSPRPVWHYLPRLKPEFYQADAVVFWTMPIANRQHGWLSAHFHAAFREMMLHAAARESLLCPAYCLMPDHIHFVWMGLRSSSDQRKAIKFLRTQLAPFLRPAIFQHQAHDHVLTPRERKQRAFSLSCTEYILLNPVRARLVQNPTDWPYLGALIPGYPRLNPFDAAYWSWFWKHYRTVLEPGIEKRKLPPREVA